MLGSNISLQPHPSPSQAQPGTQTIATIPHCVATASQHPHSSRALETSCSRFQGKLSRKQPRQGSSVSPEAYGAKGLARGPGFLTEPLGSLAVPPHLLSSRAGSSMLPL